MLRMLRSPALRYGFAILSVILATLLRLALNPALGTANVPYITYFLAVIATAWACGLGPALVSVVLSAIAAAYFFVPPSYSLALTETEHFLSLVAFLFVGAAIAVLSEAMHRARARAEATAHALRESREQLSTTLMSIGDAVIATDAKGCVTFMNPVAQALTGWPLAEAKGKQLTEVFRIVNEKTRVEVESPVAKVIREDKIVGLANHTLLLAKDGREIPIEDSGAPIRDEAGRIMGVVLVFHDVTESRHKEAALRESEERLQLTLDAARMGTWDWNAQTNEIRWSEALSPIHGLAPGTSPKTFEAFVELVHPDDRARLMDAVHHALKEGTSYNTEFRVVWPDGSIHWVGGIGHAFYDDAQRPLRMIGLALDITERKRAEDALRTSEERYRAFVQNSSEAVWRFELEQPLSIDLPEDKLIDECYKYGYLAECNDVMAGMYGFASAKEIVGARLGDFLVRSDPANVEYLRAFIRSGFRLTDAESHELDREGCPKYFLNNLVGIIENRMLLRAWGTQSDVTERKHAEAALRDSEARFRRVVESNLIGVSFSTLSGAITYANDAYLNLLGYTREELEQGKIRWDEITPPEYRERDAHAIAEIKERGVCTPFEKEHIRRDGRRVPVLVGSALLEDDDENCVAFILDLTERKRAERERAQLLEREQAARAVAERAADRTARLQSITAALSEALTPAQVAAVVLKQVVPALGARAGSVVLLSERGDELEILDAVGLPPNLLEDWRRFPVTMNVPLAVAVRTGQLVALEDLETREQLFPNLISMHALTGNHALVAIPLVVEGRSVGAMGLSFAEAQQFSDEDRAFMLAIARQCAQAITRARLYDAERRSRAEAETANRTKDEFLATLSHELRTPLTAMLGWTRLLRTSSLDETTAAHALETVERNAKAQAQLIEDILDVSRIITGKVRLEVHAVELVPVIEAALDAVRPAADAKAIQLQTELDPLAGAVSGDPARLQQVVWNLVSNAVKFTGKGGRITVGLKRVESRLQITVKDTGEGIRPEFLPFVFDRFRQADGSTTRLHGGLGLGLAIVRHLVELHGGTVSAASDGEGHGATFMVSLPILSVWPEAAAEAEQPSATDGNGSAARPSALLENLRVLVVDDEQDARELLAVVLERQGAQVSTAASVDEALQAIGTLKPDVLVSDIGMPQSDGYALMRKVRALSTERGGTMPAIAVTAYAGDDARAMTLAAGFQRHLAKPIDPAQLLEAIVSLIEQK